MTVAQKLTLAAVVASLACTHKVYGPVEHTAASVTRSEFSSAWFQPVIVGKVPTFIYHPEHCEVAYHTTPIADVFESKSATGARALCDARPVGRELDLRYRAVFDSSLSNGVPTRVLTGYEVVSDVLVEQP